MQTSAYCPVVHDLPRKLQTVSSLFLCIKAMLSCPRAIQAPYDVEELQKSAGAILAKLMSCLGMLRPTPQLMQRGISRTERTGIV